MESFVAFAATPTPTPDADLPPASEEEYYSSWSLFLVCILLLLSLLTSYYLQHRRIRLVMVHETLISICAGTLVGFVVRLAPGRMIRDMLTFKHTIFFNLLLPPIILNSGYELRQRQFFANFSTILTFAFLGTFISAVGVGLLTFVYSSLTIDTPQLSLIECLTFGSTLSATDPVTILAIFEQYKVDPKLYTVIFGESLLNDAVSIVMYETLSQIHAIHGSGPSSSLSIYSLFHGTGLFLLSFSISMFLGVFFGLGTSLLLKHSKLRAYPDIETSVVALSAYTCYFFSNGLSKSGIVSLLFCGITLKHYAYHTMSRRTQRSTRYIFATLAKLSEGFIFVYLGLSLFTSAPSGGVFGYVKPIFIFVTVVVVVFTRYAAVFPLSSLINAGHAWVWRRRMRSSSFSPSTMGTPPKELPEAYQTLLFWAGLRGAVGVALAAGFKGEHAPMLRTTVLIVVVLTILIFGGTTGRMLGVAGVKMGVEEERSDHDSDEDERGALLGALNGRRPEERDGRIGLHYPNNGLGGRVGSREYNHHHQNLHPHGQDRGSRSRRTRSGGQGQTLFSASSSDSFDFEDYDSDVGEVLPLGPTAHRYGHSDKQSTANGARPSTSDTLGVDDARRATVDHLSSSAPASPTSPAFDPSNSGSSQPRPHRTNRLSSLGLPIPSIPLPMMSLPHLPSMPSMQNLPQQLGIDLDLAQVEDGRWFQMLDERYLLPIFSNATARRSARAAQGGRRREENANGEAGRAEADDGERSASSEDEIDLSLEMESGRSRRHRSQQQQGFPYGTSHPNSNTHSNVSSQNTSQAHISTPPGQSSSRSQTNRPAPLGSLGRRSPEESTYRSERGLPSPVLRNGSNFGQGQTGF